MVPSKVALHCWRVGAPWSAHACLHARYAVCAPLEQIVSADWQSVRAVLRSWAQVLMQAVSASCVGSSHAFRFVQQSVAQVTPGPGAKHWAYDARYSALHVCAVIVSWHAFRFATASLMQAAVAGLKPEWGAGTVVDVVVVRLTVVEVVVGRRLVDVVTRTIVLEVVVGRSVVDEVDVELVDVELVDIDVVVRCSVVVVVVVPPTSSRLVHVVRQTARAPRHCARDFLREQPLGHAWKAAMVSAMQLASPWHRGPALTHAF
jgi:hypothetical protein